MAKLTTKQRNKMPASSFAVVKKVKVRNARTGKMEVKTIKKLPIKTAAGKPSRAHAANLKARINQTKGLTSAERSNAIRKANRILYGISSTKLKGADVLKEKAKKR